MSTRLEHVLNEIKELSFDELLMLQERIIGEVRSKTHPAVAPTAETENHPLSQKLKMLKMDGWPADTTFRREDIYDDRGL